MTLKVLCCADFR